jgi:hypothetical protein
VRDSRGRSCPAASDSHLTSLNLIHGDACGLAPVGVEVAAQATANRGDPESPLGVGAQRVGHTRLLFGSDTSTSAPRSST